MEPVAGTPTRTWLVVSDALPGVPIRSVIVVSHDSYLAITPAGQTVSTSSGSVLLELTPDGQLWASDRETETRRLLAIPRGIPERSEFSGAGDFSWGCLAALVIVVAGMLIAAIPSEYGTSGLVGLPVMMIGLVVGFVALLRLAFSRSTRNEWPSDADQAERGAPSGHTDLGGHR